MMKNNLFTLMIAATLPLCAAVKVETIDYVVDGQAMQGFLGYDDAVTAKRPGILVIPANQGVVDFEKDVVRKLVGMGYVAFAVDMFGKGTIPEENQVQASKIPPEQLLARSQAGLEIVKKNSRIDANRTAVIGFCFGGGVALRLARTGADVLATTTVHGSFTSLAPAFDDFGKIKGRLQIIHGAEDGAARLEIVQDMMAALRKTKVDWEAIIYSGTKHAFMVPRAGPDAPGKASAYNPVATERGWKVIDPFLSDVLRAK